MIIAVLAVLGLCLGSFVNALVWRLSEQAKTKKPSKELSILHGRSMCPQCRHTLKALDLLPLLSWLALRGKCRYCGQPISAQYPLVEAATALLFIGSYTWWPNPVHGVQVALLGLWLVILTGLMALVVYDLRWMLLPNRIMRPLSYLAVIYACLEVIAADKPGTALLNTVLAVAVGGGIFYILYQLSGGKWIGGGDVKLGWLLGLIAGTPGRSLLFIFIAAMLGSLVSLPLLAVKRLKRSSTIPFGPFLIVGVVVVQLFGHSILDWYQSTFFPYL